MKTQNGFSIVEIVIVLAVVVLVGALGYVGWNAMMDNKADSVQTKTSQSQTPTKIESSEDLDNAESTLDDTSLDDTDAAAAEKQADL